ncbi:MAG: hypothetical protein J6K21_02100 [Bacilli bacterium]|nr:hypothetical protein [Bacilli bacterium]
MKEKKLIDSKGRINHLGLLIQVVLIVLFIIFAISNMFIKGLDLVANYILIALLFVMAYNNHTLYKRKAMTIVYISVSIILLVTTIITNING